MKNLFTLNHYFVKYQWRLILGVIFVTASNYFSILIPQKMRDALDLVQSKIEILKATEHVSNILFNQLSESLLIFGLIVTFFAIVKGIMMYYMRQTLIVMSRLIEYDIRKEVFAHIQTFDQKYLRSHQTGDIMARISEDVSKVRDYLGPGILYGINLITLFAMTIYAMLQVDVKLTIYALLPGGKEEDGDRDKDGIIDVTDDTKDLIELLQSKNVLPDDIVYSEDINGKHDYATWSKQLPAFLIWAFGK